MLKVALLADPMYQSLQAGTSRYTRQLASHLLADGEIDLQLFTLYSPQIVAEARQHGLHAELEARSPVFSHSSRGPRAARYLLWHWLGWSGSIADAMQDADVVHTPLVFVPPRRRAPLLVTVHDLSCRLYPQYHTFRNRLLNNSGMRRALKDEVIFIANSVYTANDLMRLENVPHSRVYPVPLAADERFKPTPDAGTLARYGITPPYVLYVGTLEPRKNIASLLRAFAGLDHARLARRVGTPVKLVIAGGKGWMYQEIFDLAHQLGLDEHIQFTGFVSDEDLPALYTGALTYVFPSLFEGFGLPVLEALSCGTPVITSNVASLPEVAGDAALLVAPNDVAALRHCLQRVLTEPALREEMRAKGLAQASQFSWHKTAAMTAEVYRNVASKR